MGETALLSKKMHPSQPQKYKKTKNTNIYKFKGAT
jgi:hypothetical protein